MTLFRDQYCLQLHVSCLAYTHLSKLWWQLGNPEVSFPGHRTIIILVNTEWFLNVKLPYIVTVWKVYPKNMILLHEEIKYFQKLYAAQIGACYFIFWSFRLDALRTFFCLFVLLINSIQGQRKMFIIVVVFICMC